AAMSLASVVAVLAVSSATGLGAWVLWPGAVAAGAGLFAWNAVVMLAAVTGSEARHAGRASGVVHLGFLSGLALGPVSFGFLVDSTGTYAWSWTGVGVLCLLGALLARAWVAADND
ncbi:MAG TPA: hypothetical protein VF058_04705, partial [Actinomycetota bacterium]